MTAFRRPIKSQWLQPGRSDGSLPARWARAHRLFEYVLYTEEPNREMAEDTDS